MESQFRLKFALWGVSIALFLLLTAFVSVKALWVAIPAAAAVLVLSFVSLGTIQGYHYALDRARKEYKQLQTKFQDQSLSFDGIASGLDVGIIICDLKGSVTYANKTARELFRFENPTDKSLLAVTLSTELEAIMMAAIEEKTRTEAELVFSFPTERVCHAACWCEKEDPHEVFISLIELTELRRLERVRTDFVANVSHELRTPMTVIRSYAETMLEAQISTAERTKYLNRIVTEIDRLTAISHDLLILSSAESKLASKGICDIGELCAYTYGLLKGKAEEKGLEFTIRGPDRLLIEANGAQMSQVILNLVENAIKYTTEGRVEMSLTNHGSEVIFSVEDTGVGVSSDHLPRLFERFYRVDKARSRSTGGTGLGLSIVKHVVEAHGGSVDVQSSLNSGTTFTIRLPKGQIITESQVSEGNSPSLFD